MVTSISPPTQKSYLEHITCSQLLIKTQELFLASGFFFFFSFGILCQKIFVFLSYIFQITADPMSGNLFDILKSYFSSSDILNLSSSVSITFEWFSSLQVAQIRYILPLCRGNFLCFILF